VKLIKKDDKGRLSLSMKAVKSEKWLLGFQKK
jgi:predicted RNA-binding protein with RPS1 domain